MLAQEVMADTGVDINVRKKGVQYIQIALEDCLACRTMEE
jgi:hypothetical protein